MNLQNFSTYRILPASPPRALARARLSLALSPKCARKLLRSVAERRRRGVGGGGNRPSRPTRERERGSGVVSRSRFLVEFFDRRRKGRSQGQGSEGGDL